MKESSNQVEEEAQPKNIIEVDYVKKYSYDILLITELLDKNKNIETTIDESKGLMYKYCNKKNISMKQEQNCQLKNVMKI